MKSRRPVNFEVNLQSNVMSRDDWFRRHTWSASDRTEFFARLAKSRSNFHKAQYARIQAYELHHGGGKQYAHSALELLDLILERWKSDAELAAVYHQKAQCFLDLGDSAGALAAFREAFAQQRRVPSSLTSAHLDFAWWVAVSEMRELFDEAFGVLEEFTRDGIVFPKARYQAEGARALMLKIRGDLDEAARHARNAMEAAAQQHTGLRYHPTVGLVKIADRQIHEALSRLAAG
jgi:tetratricopeptide (TPR) repeat protein